MTPTVLALLLPALFTPPAPATTGGEPVLLAKAVDPDCPTQAVLGRSLAASAGALLCGAPYANAGPGFATLFQVGSDGRATVVQDLTWSGSQVDDYFGWSTALTTARAVIGIRNANDVGALRAGKVQLYVRGIGSQGQVQLTEAGILKSTQPRKDGLFGWAVALQGSRLAVGEPGGEGATTNTGTVQVFELGGASPQLTGLLSDPNGSDGDALGHTVLVDGSFVYATSLHQDVGGVVDAGAVHVFQRTPQGAWKHAAELTAPTSSAGAEFGYALEVVGDELYVGAPKQLVGGVDCGVVHRFQRQPGGYVLAETITPPQALSQFLFGTSVQVDGNRMYVGAPGSNATAGRAGEVLVFTRTGSTWTYDSAFQPIDIGVGDRFGLDVVLDQGRLVASAKGGDEPYFNSGGAYVYALDGTPPAPMVALHRFVDAGTGTSHYMLLRPGRSRADDHYLVLGSADPTPSIVGGLPLPFTLDAYSTLTWDLANAAPFSATLGRLDGNGEALAEIRLLPFMTASLAGLTLLHATIVVDDATLAVTDVLGPTQLSFVP